MTALNPVLPIGLQITEIARRASRPARRGGDGARAIELLDQVGIPDAARAARRLPARVLRRHAPARDDRHRARRAARSCCSPTSRPRRSTSPSRTRSCKLLLRLKDELGMSVILVTHDLGVVAETCDRVAVMYAGRVMETGAGGRRSSPRPSHAYTLGLLRSLPDAAPRAAACCGPSPARRRDPRALPPGCRFAPRCGFVDRRLHRGASRRSRRSSPAHATRLHPRRRAACAESWPRELTAAAARSTICPKRFPAAPHRSRPGCAAAAAARRARAARRQLRASSAARRWRSSANPAAASPPWRARWCGCIDADAGQIDFDGEDVRTLRGAALRRYNRRVQMVFQDPYGSLNPRMTVGEIAWRGAARAPHACRAPRRPRRGSPNCSTLVRLPADAAVALSARVLRRPAPAHRHRPRALGRAGAADRRRDRLRARRLGAGADPEPAAGHAGAAGPRDPVRLARPARGAPPRAPRRGHVSRPRRRARRRPRRCSTPRATPTRRRCSPPRRSLEPGAAQRRRRPCAASCRARCARAAGLPVPSALPASPSTAAASSSRPSTRSARRITPRPVFSRPLSLRRDPAKKHQRLCPWPPFSAE